MDQARVNQEKQEAASTLNHNTKMSEVFHV